MKYSTLMDFISQDREVEKILIVRDRHWAADELDLCALDGIPSAGIHIMTLEEVLSEFAMPGEELLRESECLVILEKVLRRLQKSGVLKYYCERLNSPTLTGELWKVISEIRMSDIHEKPNREFHPRIGELLKLMEEYKKEIERLGKKDLVGGWRVVRGEEMNSRYQYAVYADISVHYLERQFLDHLPDLTVLKVPKVSSSIPKSFYSSRGFDENIHYYFENDRTLSKDHVLRFERHYLPGQEIRSIFEDIQKKKISPAEVEIVYADPSYARPFLEEAQRFSVSVEMGDGVDISSPLLSDWFSTFESFCQSKCGFTEFERLMSRALFDFTKPTIDMLMTLFQKRNFRSGYENYSIPENLDLVTSEEVSKLREFLKDLMELVPRSMFDTASYKEYGEKLLQFFGRYVPPISEENESAEKVSLRAELHRQLNLWEEHWKTVFDEPMNYSRIFRRLNQMCSTFPAKKPLFSFPSVLIRGLSPRRPWKRKHCYLCGLTANVFPKVIEESPVLNDEERALLSQELSTSEIKNEEEKYEIRKLMASFSNDLYRERGRCLYLSCPMFDLSTNTEAISSIMPERWARAYGEKGWTDFGFYSDREAVSETFGDFSWIKNSLEERAENEKLLREFVFSSSSLEQLLKCPQCFYYKYVMRLPEHSEERKEEWEWLDAKTKGILCHEILSSFFKRRESENKKTVEQGRVLFLDIIDDEIQKVREKIPPIRRRVFEDATFKIRSSMMAYFDEVLTSELQLSSKFDSERSFREIVHIGKHSILLTGRIDLIGHREGELLLVDFKTGKRKNIATKSHSDELIQDMLYREAMDAHYGRGKPIRTEYHFPFEELKDMRFSETDVTERFGRGKEKIEKTIDLILEYGFVSSKHFTHVPDGYEILLKNSKEVEKAHLYSDFKDICR